MVSVSIAIRCISIHKLQPDRGHLMRLRSLSLLPAKIVLFPPDSASGDTLWRDIRFHCFDVGERTIQRGWHAAHLECGIGVAVTQPSQRI